MFAYLIAKHNNGKFVLRIDNTDISREVAGSEEFVYQILNTFNIPYDEGPKKIENKESYYQNERHEIYLKYAEQLVKEKKAYYCFCNEAKLDKMRIEAEDKNEVFIYDEACYHLTEEEINEKLKYGQEYVIRLHINDEETTSFYDEVYKNIRVFNDVVEDPILIKSDKTATYNFANVIDDYLFGITHVVRGNEYLSSMPKYIRIYEALNWEPPKFIHLPLIVKKNNKKISKRLNDDNVLDLINVGFLPEAILNYVALLGWSPNDTKEFFTLDELIKIFDYHDINKNPAIYDLNKLIWFNKHYLKKLSDDDYLALVKPFLNKYYDVTNKDFNYLNNILLLYRNHIKYGLEIISYVKPFFVKDIILNEEQQKYVDTNKSILNELITNLKNIDIWNVDNIVNIIEKLKQDNVNLYYLLRIKITGLDSGPAIAKIMAILGKDETIKRLER